MGTFKVLQFNIQFGQGWNESDPDGGEVDLGRTIAEIRAQDADIVLLQEVEHAQNGGRQAVPPPNYTRLRAAFPGYDGFFRYPKADPRELPFGIGLAILSKTPLYATLWHDLPSPPVEFEFQGEKKTPTDRLLIGATTTLGGRALRIFNTHLLAFFMLETSSEQHHSQRDFLVEQLRASDGPTLLGGDFNVSQHESLVNQFAAAGYRTAQTAEITWRRRPYILDHVFYSRHLKLQRTAVIPTPASDHHMLVTEFSIGA